jgi:hypothetical protein
MLFFSCGRKTSPPLHQTKPKDSSFIQKDSLYEVYKIDSINIFYLVYAKRKGINFKIVSKKSASLDCNKIQVASRYEFKLQSILRQEVKLGDKSFSSIGNLLVNCFTFEQNTEICREEGISDLHRAENLNGLCLVKD